MDIQFEIKEQTLIRKSETEHPVEGSKNYLKTKFEFTTSEWDGLIKFALFKNEQGIEFTKYLGRGDYGECFVPYEALKGDYFTVTIYAGDLITTNEVIVSLVRSGYRKCNSGVQDAYVDIYDELDTKISKEEMASVYYLVNEKVDKDCFQGFFDARMTVWLQDLTDAINEL